MGPDPGLPVSKWVTELETETDRKAERETETDRERGRERYRDRDKGREKREPEMPKIQHLPARTCWLHTEGHPLPLHCCSWE